jgi:hypothetical protein
MLQEQSCSSGYSMTFLKWLDKLGKLLKRDAIEFCLRNDHPLKAALKIRELGETEILYFLAPRAEEAEFEDDEEEDAEELSNF